MPRPALGLRVYGIQNAQGRVTRFQNRTKQRITAVLEAGAPDVVEEMRQALYARYDQGGGRVARSLKSQVQQTGEGASVQISVTNYREVKYMTTLVPDSDFRPFPYPIVAHNTFMRFYWKRLGAWVNLKYVTHPGFGPNDVMRESGQQALSRLGYMVEYEVASAVAEVTAGGRSLMVGRGYRQLVGSFRMG